MNSKHTPTDLTIREVRYQGIPRYEIASQFSEREQAEQVVRAANAYEKDQKLIGYLVSQLRQHHEDAVDVEHFERLAAGDMGCTTCALIAKAEGLPNE